jgi:nitroimidazol reductase NimA-like FMN-containing flavoprotein (pyridoxamine 5'-phosphate oxidase superfamily)
MMFRELTRKNKQLSPSECVEILTAQPRGVLSVLGDDDFPYGMPMNHYYNAEDGAIYFHCGRSGHRLDALMRHDKVSFCVCTDGIRHDGDWALTIKSVIVFGHITVIDDLSTICRIAAALSRKFTQDEQYIEQEISRFATDTLLLKLTPDHICGKTVHEA